MPKNAPVLKVAVFAEGSLTADGVGSTLPALLESFHNLHELHGGIWYYGEPADIEPPIAKQVLKMVVAAMVPVRLCGKADFSDRV